MRRMRRHPFRSLAAVVLLAALTAFAVPALAATHKKPKTRVLKVGDFFFVKDSNHTPTVHVAPGTVMKWHFVGMEDHNVTVYGKSPAKFHSHDMDHGFYKHRVFKQGTYMIMCTIHGFKMRLIVGKPSPKPTPTPSPTPTTPTTPTPSPYPVY
jgi:plastocyanin